MKFLDLFRSFLLRNRHKVWYCIYAYVKSQNNFGSTLGILGNPYKVNRINTSDRWKSEQSLLWSFTEFYYRRTQRVSLTVCLYFHYSGGPPSCLCCCGLIQAWMRWTRWRRLKKQHWSGGIEGYRLEVKEYKCMRNVWNKDLI